MTRVVFLALFLIGILGELDANTVSCKANAFISVSAVVCNNNNTLDGSDDYISFDINGQNSKGAIIGNLPSDVNIPSHDQLELYSSDTFSTITLKGDGTYSLKVPAKSCQPLTLSVQWNGSDCNNSLLIVDSRAEIPTLGQWGILILLISIFIIGYLEIKKTKNRPIYLRTTFQY